MIHISLLKPIVLTEVHDSRNTIAFLLLCLLLLLKAEIKFSSPIPNSAYIMQTKDIVCLPDYVIELNNVS